MDVQGVSLSIASSFLRRTVFKNAGYPASGQAGTGMKKNADAGTSPVQK